MDLNLPTPPDGADPYAFYGDLLHRWTMLSPTDPAGFRARLAVLLFLCAFLGLSSAVNFVVHALGYYSKGRRLWLFKTVKRDSGTHIISNHFLLATLGGLALFVILLGNTLTLWRAVVSPGGGTSQEYLAKWSFALWPVAYLVAWTLSWATFQSYLQVEGGTARAFGRSWKVMPAWLENALFIGGGIATVAVHTTLAIIGSAASTEQWRQYRILKAMLDREAATWEGGPMPAATAGKLVSLLRQYAKASSHFFTTASNLSIGAAVLPLFLVITNLAMVAFVYTIRRHIRFQISQLPSLQGLSRGVPPSALTSPQGARIVSLPPALELGIDPSSGDDAKQELELDLFACSPDGPPSPTASPSPTTRFVTLPPVEPPFSAAALSPTSVPRPTRAQVLELADDVEAAKLGIPSQQVASRIAALIKAERELLLLGLAVIIIAVLLAVTSAWSVPVLRRFDTASWVKTELVLTLPIWICSVGISIGQALHAYVECRYVIVPWWRGQRYDARECRLSAATTSDGQMHPHALDVGMMRQVQQQELRDAHRSRAKTLARGLGLARLSPAASSPGRSGSSTPVRGASGVDFDGAIAVAIEVTRREEVADEPEPLDLVERRNSLDADLMGTSSSGDALSSSGGAGTASWEKRRREVWEQ